MNHLTGNLLVFDSFTQTFAEDARICEILSPDFETPAFDKLVPSWNTTTPRGTSVEVFASVRHAETGVWSAWHSFGLWGATIARHSGSSEDEIASVDTDTLAVKGEANGVRLRILLRRECVDATPVLRRVFATLRCARAPIAPVCLPAPAASVRLTTPAYSQMDRHPDIGRVICSATTMTALLNDREEDLLPEEISAANFDYVYRGYGNWPFTTAAAGELGYRAYVQYGTFDLLRGELAAGRSVGMAVHYSSSPDGDHPYLENGAARNTAGHLIAICGYCEEDGVEYYFSCDSASNGDANCLRRYRRDQLDVAWGGRILYLVDGKEQSERVFHRVDASLTALGGQEYALEADGAPVALAEDFVACKKERADGGTIAFTISGFEDIPVAEGTRRTLANRRFRYVGVSTTERGTLLLDPAAMLVPVPADSDAEVTLFIVRNDCTTFVARTTLHKPLGAPVVPDDAASVELYREGR